MCKIDFFGGNFCLKYFNGILHLIPERRLAERALDDGVHLRLRQRSLDSKPGGHVVMSTFAEDGPERCSGLPVQRHSRQDLLKALGPRFTLLAHEHELHTTPGGMSQAFNHALLRFA